MSIIKNLMEAIPLVDEANRKILEDLLVKKFEEHAEIETRQMKLETSKEMRDYQELMNYNGGE